MRIKLLLLLLLPFFGFGQVDLVKWNGPYNATPTISAAAASAVSAGNITGNNINLQLNSSNEGFKTFPWPTEFNIDENKYVEFSLGAQTGYKVKLSSFNFTYKANANIKRYQVRYSLDNFATSFLLIDEAAATSFTNKSLSLSNVTLYPGAAAVPLKIRIYAYKLTPNTWSDSPIDFWTPNLTAGSQNTSPKITGTVLPYETNELNANDDVIETKEKKAISFNALANDTNYNGSVVSYTQPLSSAGTVAVNNDIFIFTPADGFTGKTSFTYTLTKGNKSSTATVYVVVNQIVSSLIIWNGAIQTPKAVVTDSNITGNDLITSSSNSLSIYENYFNILNVGSTNLDLNKYAQVSITAKLNKKLALSKFEFIYFSPNNSQGATKYQVRYSTDPNFSGGGIILAGETIAVKGVDTKITLSFPAGTTVSSTNALQTFYIRIYPYAMLDVSNNNNINFRIKNDYGGDIGPTISGVVDSANVLTANPDIVTTSSNTAITIPILTNDEGYSALQTITVIQPSVSQGSVTVNGITGVTFTPATGFTGATNFTYTLFNGTAYSSATVTLTVTPPPCVASSTPGVNFWKGYVYTYTGGTPAATTYVGSIAEKANFDREIAEGTITGDASVEVNNFCGTIPNDNFFVKYLMNVSLTEAGLYTIKVGADDGYRLYIDDILVPEINNWSDHSYSTSVVNKTLTAGNHVFRLEYYEKGGSARVSFSYGLPKGDPTLPFGKNVWNVYGFTRANLDFANTELRDSYAGYYVDPAININSQTFWNKGQSPSVNNSSWNGMPIQIDNFTFTYKRKGFPCGRYQIQLVNCDDVAQVYLNGTLIFTQTYTVNGGIINNNAFYTLNKDSEIEVRLREDGGDANVAFNFIEVPFVYDGTTTPPSGSSITVNQNSNLANNLDVCSCYISTGKTLTVPANSTLTVHENIDIKANGKLIIKNNGSLLQDDNGIFTGAADSFIMERTSSPMKNFDFTYWSSPVAGQTLVGLSPNTLSDKYMSYSGSGWTQETPSNIMKPGIGYIIRVPKPNFWPNQTAASYSQPVEFKGIPNNGNITNSQDMTPGKFYLVGNPYPSALDADEFLFKNVNNSNILKGTIYFWTHNTGITQSGSQYVYASNDYASYNLTGGVGTSASSSGNKTEPQGFIAAGQSFFASTKGTGKVEFNNSMRIEANNNQFFKPGKTSKKAGLEKHRLWLNLTNEKGAYKQTLIGYVEGASNDFDDNFDGMSFDGNSFVDFYSVNNTDNLTIQGRALPFKDSDEVPLGYRTTVAGDFTISINNADGVLANQTVYLIDKQTNTVNDLTARNYTFNTAAGKFNNRFVLKYTNKTLGTGDFEVTDDAVSVVIENKSITVNSTLENIENIFIYDISGKLLYKKEKTQDLHISIQNLPFAQQILIVKVILQNGNTITKKVIFK
ncbi:T9SS sorting signal type C domain-containing protein [Flavobacterium sp.]|uniref:Ig-like domain-containing protein n=1 Tax=Flavobacterium sp. TaxID=239 RepID=UPI003267985B